MDYMTLKEAKADWLIGINATRLFSICRYTFLPESCVHLPQTKIISDRMISSARLRMLFMVPTHASWSRAFSSSVTLSASCICETIHASRSAACSFRSARYVQSFPNRSSALYWPGRCSCRNVLCIRPTVQWGGFPPAASNRECSSLPPACS